MNRECIFCSKFLKLNQVIAENNSCVAFFDEYPVNRGHILILSKRHVETFFDLEEKEQIDFITLLNKCKKIIDEKYKPDGYNVGLNCGVAAGQTIMHVHLHLIPRYFGDVDNPKGGIRGVIPKKKLY